MSEKSKQRTVKKYRVLFQQSTGVLKHKSMKIRIRLKKTMKSVLRTGFFLTPAAEKTKTQGQNSSKKLKEKTQPLGGRSLPYAKLKKKTKTHCK